MAQWIKRFFGKILKFKERIFQTKNLDFEDFSYASESEYAIPADLGLTEKEVLFINTLNDLSNKVNSNEPYEILLASALIRKLLLDDAPLLHQVNRKYKFKFEYHVGDILEPPDAQEKLIAWGALDGIEPDNDSGESEVIKKTEKTFLAMIIGAANGKDYTVKDLVKYVANVMGGVHPGSTEAQQKEKLHILENYYVTGLNIPLAQIRSIAKVTLRALKPLKEKLLRYDDIIGADGIGIHLILTPMPLRDRNNFIFDIGINEQRNRFFAYINSGNRICFRFYDDLGRYHVIDGGSAGQAFHYGQPIYLGFEVAMVSEKIMLKIDIGELNYLKVYNGKVIFPKNLYYVIGSNFKGKEHSHISVYVNAIYYPKTCDNKLALEKFFAEKMKNLPRKTVLFKGNKFMHSDNHPLFTKREKKKKR